VVEMFEEFVKRRVCQNGGGVAHGWMCWFLWDAMIFCNNFAR
jgi:hypothetical protein